VLANDLSPEAVAAMNRNIQLNGLGPAPEVEQPADMQADELNELSKSHKDKKPWLGKVRANQGDAWSGFLIYVPTEEVYPHAVPLCSITEQRKTEWMLSIWIHTAAQLNSLTLRFNVCAMEVGLDFALKELSITSVGAGLLCVTCTDLAVLATTNYSEKWYVVRLNPSPNSTNVQLCELRRCTYEG
jgi:tRNA (guanine26-N2/guanine27-N2)-dimethyltransferase